MSALPPKADIGTQSRNVRFVPKADSGTAAKTASFGHVGGRGDQLPGKFKFEHAADQVLRRGGCI